MRNPEQPAANAKAEGGHGRRSQRAARVPAPPAGSPHRAAREALPVYEHRAELLEAIESNQVVVIEGETGCGKSTQVPQYVLEDAATRGKPCSIIVTQPRRISALGVSERVAAERGEAVGGVVGYSIRLESKSSAQTALLFCTTGILYVCMYACMHVYVHVCMAALLFCTTGIFTRRLEEHQPQP